MSEPHDPFAAVRSRHFQRFLLYRFLFVTSVMMLGTVVGWQLYALTKDPLSLGLLGLAEAVPYLGTSLFGGFLADRVNRKKIALVCSAVFTLCGGVLLAASLADSKLLVSAWFYYGLIFMTGIARGFLAPAISALFAQVLPREHYANGAAWNTNVWQSAAVAGPALGGLLLGWFGATATYGILTTMCAVSVVMLWSLPKYELTAGNGMREGIIQSIRTGVRFVFANQIILGALTLDLVAVLFAGAMAVLPVFVTDVLHSGPQTLGYLRAAPFAGSVMMGFVLASRRPMERAGDNLMRAVAAYGVCMILFALSKNFYLSFALLFFSGIFDNVSVVIRSTILQLSTPDEMRGRVSAVNNIFVGTSNELGAFESGTAAKLLGLVPSVMLGGAVSIVAVVATAWKAPRLRSLNLQRLQE